MTPERLSNGLACRDIRDLYWDQQETDDPKSIADIDRQLIDFLLKLAESDEVFKQLGLKKMEVRRLKKHRKITDEVRRKLRDFAADFARNNFGT